MVPASPSINATNIAEYFIWKSQQERSPVTNKKLQKLLYYTQAWSLVLLKEKMFTDDIEAWVHGPAVREVYLKYKDFGFEPITETVDSQSFKFNDDQVKLMNDIWSVYGCYDAGYLEALSHSEDPWKQARAGLDADAASQNIIDPKIMTTYYSKRLEESQNINT